jgi:cobalt-zinc-cadmium efflux system membrane fusion protein
LAGFVLKCIVVAGCVLVTALPEEAIVDYQGKKYIFIPTVEEAHGDEKSEGAEGHVEGKPFKMVEVQTGNAENGYTEIFLPEGVNENTEVVVKGTYAILSKIKNSEEEGGHAH